MTHSTEQRDLDQIEKQLKRFSTLSRDRNQAAATYQAITGKPLGWRDRFGLLRPVAAVAVLLLLATPFALGGNQVGGLFGQSNPTPSPTVSAQATVETHVQSSEQGTSAEADAQAELNTSQGGSSGVVPANPGVPAVPPVQKPKLPLLQNVQNTVSGVLGGHGL